MIGELLKKIFCNHSIQGGRPFLDLQIGTRLSSIGSKSSTMSAEDELTTSNILHLFLFFYWLALSISPRKREVPRHYEE